MLKNFSWRSILFLILYFCFLIVYCFFPIKEKEFYIQDKSISKKMMEESFKNSGLILLLVFFPIIYLFCLLEKNNFLLNVENYFLANCMVALCCEIIKHAVGRHRPDFLERKNLKERKNLSFYKRSIVNEGKMSFPSGHSAHSLCSMCFLIVLVLKNKKICKKTKILLILNKINFAFVICLTRILENYHHIEDVICGSFIGITFSLFNLI